LPYLCGMKKQSYKKILTKPFGNILADKEVNGSALNFIENHTALSQERLKNARLSDFDSESLINENLLALKEYTKLINNPSLKKMIKAAADLERYIIMNTAKGLVEVKKDRANNKINDVKREWLVARASFPTNDPKNQFIRVNIGSIDKETDMLIDKKTGKKYAIKGSKTEEISAKIINEEIDRRMNENGTLQQLVSNLKKCINELD
jgi:hypothetical protein